MQISNHEHLQRAASHLSDMLPQRLQEEASISSIEKPGCGPVLFVYLPESVRHLKSRLPQTVDGFAVVYEFSDPYSLM